MSGHRRVFTSENLALMQAMADKGCSARDIAEKIGSTPSSVRVVCSHKKIRLRRGHRCAGRTVPWHLEQLPEPHRKVEVVTYMPESLYAEFNRKANDLREPVSNLASMLLNAIVSSDLYKAVLDD